MSYQRLPLKRSGVLNTSLGEDLFSLMALKYNNCTPVEIHSDDFFLNIISYNFSPHIFIYKE